MKEVDYGVDQDATAAIEQVFSSVFRGEHVVVGSRSLLEYLATKQWSIASRAALTGILARLSELRSISGLQQYKVVLSSESDSQISKISPGIWKVPIHHFSNVALTPSCVVAENIRDANALEICANHFHMENGAKGLRVSLVKEGSGGPEVVTAMKQKITDKRQFVLSVTDTDKSNPASPECPTSSKCSSLSKMGNWVAEHVSVHGREIENALPQNLFRDSEENSDAWIDNSSSWDFLEHRVFPEDDVANWVDLKKGTFLVRTSAVNTDEADRAYWGAAANAIAEPFHSSKECIDGHCCKDMKSCKCVLHSWPWGQGLRQVS
ncbi:MAG: hypothetical protein IPK34_17330 [Ramlibacter sp.]|nr:hypothetical protein [Ramlibacter sp.]